MTSPVLFLSHSGHDTETAKTLKKRLLASPDACRAGLQVWLDVDDLVEGQPWQAQLEAAIVRATGFAVVIGSKGIINWVRAETDLGMSRAVKEPGFRFTPVLLNGQAFDDLTPFASRFHAVRDPLGDTVQLQRLLRAALGQDEAGLPRLTDAPFPGLRSMTEVWADRFFGRRAETDAVLALLRQHQAVSIIADSGAGKSSLAMAGVAPAWRGGALRDTRPRAEAPEAWHVVIMRPGDQPLAQLRGAIETAARALGRPAAISQATAPTSQPTPSSPCAAGWTPPTPEPC